MWGKYDPIRDRKYRQYYLCVFPTQASAAREMGLNQGNINNCVSGRDKTAGGFRWQAY